MPRLRADCQADAELTGAPGGNSLFRIPARCQPWALATGRGLSVSEKAGRPLSWPSAAEAVARLNATRMNRRVISQVSQNPRKRDWPCREDHTRGTGHPSFALDRRQERTKAYLVTQRASFFSVRPTDGFRYAIAPFGFEIPCSALPAEPLCLQARFAKGHNSDQARLAIQYRQTMYLLAAHPFAAAFVV